jgi:uncharacterized protein
MQTNLPTAPGSETSELARRRLLAGRGEPLFFADWERALFLHYEVDRSALQSEVPFPLDLREGRAYVSLVAFTIRGLRLRFGGPLGKWLCRPIAAHEFLNVRTYVRHRGEAGIYFLGEWLPNPLSVLLGPRTFGLPYRRAEIEYRHTPETGMLQGSVAAGRTVRRLRYEATIDAGAAPKVCGPGSLEEFLIERYVAFTSHNGRHRFFRIWHEPWRLVPAEATVFEQGLVTDRWPWFGGAEFVGANYSAGVRDVWMGWPHGTRVGKTRRPGPLEGFFDLL